MITNILFVKQTRTVPIMRMSQAEKDKSHARIVSGASRLLRERGLEGASVADVMKIAGLTHGGFYKHFDSKDALVVTALNAAFADFIATLSQDDPESAYAEYRRLYLSPDHVGHPGVGCPVPALGAEIARSSSTLKAAFGRGVQRVVEAIARTGTGTPVARRTAALRTFSMMVGAVVIARASDQEFADRVLAACRKTDGH